jgi:hypothetical protein
VGLDLDSTASVSVSLASSPAHGQTTEATELLHPCDKDHRHALAFCLKTGQTSGYKSNRDNALHSCQPAVWNGPGYGVSFALCVLDSRGGHLQHPVWETRANRRDHRVASAAALPRTYLPVRPKVKLLQVGARPNFPKLAPVHRAGRTAGLSQVVVHTDTAMTTPSRTDSSAIWESRRLT